MKRILMAASALAALGIATGAAAHDSTKALTVDGFARKECHIHATNTTVHIGNIINHDGFLNTSINSTIANDLTALGITAWCNGNHNGVNLYRTALVNQVHNGTGGAGTQDANGFNTAALYDLGVNIATATRADTTASPLEDTTDGIGNGPGMGAGAFTSVSDFGPTGSGEPVSFVTAGPTPSAVTVGNPGGDLDDGLYTDNGNRLAAGPYQSTVTLVLQPGV